MQVRAFFFVLAVLVSWPAFGQISGANQAVNQTMPSNPIQPSAAGIPAPDSSVPALEVATLGAGCFWCIEAVLQDLKGVTRVVSGYSGGHVENPSYKAVCAGTTGHAEVIQVFFDPQVIAYRDVLEVFFNVHDPTTLNRQGNDVGPQYRSAIFYHSPEQQQVAQEMKQTAQAWWPEPIVTEIAPFTKFYPAEDYHQNYYKDNPNQPYCSFVIAPKYRKFREKYKERLKG
jgi:peptide-methionine (S)-S-oxide reductase